MIYANKTDDNMKYEQQFYKIVPGNYELDEIIDVLKQKKVFKDTRMEIELDKQK